MDFFTTVKIPKYPFDIHHKYNMLMMGSCFTENIGNLLKADRIPVVLNPLGIMYNPVSISTFLTKAQNRSHYREEDLLHYNNLYHSWDAHGSLSHKDSSNVIQNLNKHIEDTYDYLKKSPLIVITLGTAYAYVHKHTKSVVANCHKYPQYNFDKILLSVEEILEHLSELVQSLPTIKFLFTISPVRHWRDGGIENQRSKSHLFVAIHQLIDKYPDACYYFPAYELVMDELRDYRYYNEDMLHPNSVAVKFIYERFSAAFFTDETSKKIAIAQRYEKLIRHRPLHKDNVAYQAWEQQIAEVKENLENIFS